MANKKLGMVIDIHRCMGCHTCAVACKNENNLPINNWWNRILTDGGEGADSEAGTYPNVRRDYYTLACQHCANPACVSVCPVRATYKDDSTGIVQQDYDKCIGCRMCMAACPYTGVRSFNWNEPQYLYDFAVGDETIAPHQKHVVEKCTLCSHRVRGGDEPACIDACPAVARYFGDFNDPESQVSKLIASRPTKQLLTEKGTQPNVYFLTDK